MTKTHMKIFFTGDDYPLEYEQDEFSLRNIENCIMHGNPFLVRLKNRNVYINLDKVDAVEFIYANAESEVSK